MLSSVTEGAEKGINEAWGKGQRLVRLSIWETFLKVTYKFGKQRKTSQENKKWRLGMQHLLSICEVLQNWKGQN